MNGNCGVSGTPECTFSGCCMASTAAVAFDMGGIVELEVLVNGIDLDKANVAGTGALVHEALEAPMKHSSRD